MRPVRIAGLLLATSMAVACTNHSAVGPSPINSADPASASASTSDEGVASGTMAPNLTLAATVKFGNPQTGTGFFPPGGHDQSQHAFDTLVPGTVVIDQGGTVTFQAVGIHQIAIYEPGKRPEDVDVGDLIPNPCDPGLPPLIDDDEARVDINGSNPGGCGPRVYTHTFDEPGRYLVICAVLPHFNINMYGWVIVRER